MHNKVRNIAIWGSGLAAFAPILLMVLASVLGPYLSPEEFGLFAASGLIASGVIVCGFCLYALVTTVLPITLKIVWVPALIFGNILLVPAFWVVHVWGRRRKSTDWRTARPMLMTVGMLGTGLWTAASIAGLIMHLLGIGGQKLELTNQPESDFLSTPGGLSFLIVTSFFATIAYGMARERAWVRPLVPAFWLYAAVEIILFHQIIAESVSYFVLKLSIIAGVGGLSCWYFYVKTDVVNYFGALAERHSSEFEGPSSGI
jgi:hypothetical protein